MEKKKRSRRGCTLHTPRLPVLLEMLMHAAVTGCIHCGWVRLGSVASLPRPSGWEVGRGTEKIPTKPPTLRTSGNPCDRGGRVTRNRSPRLGAECLRRRPSQSHGWRVETLEPVHDVTLAVLPWAIVMKGSGPAQLPLRPLSRWCRVAGQGRAELSSVAWHACREMTQAA